MTKEEALSAVAKRIADCEQCRFSPEQKPVPGEGNPEAEIFFVGEAPGQKENETGRPFVGAAGKFLAELLESIGLTREDIFIANTLKYQPPANRDPLPEEIEYQKPFLLKQISIVQPLLICFLGRHAMKALLPENTLPISQLHGQLLLEKGRYYLPLYHPAAALYNGSMRSVLLEDFSKIPAYMDRIKAES